MLLPFAAILAMPLFYVGVPWTFRLSSVGLIAGMLIIGVAASKRGAQNASKALARKLARVKPEVYFGEQGLFADGDFTPWLSVGVYLKAAFRDERPPRSLTLQFQKILPAYGSMRSVTMTVNLPLPRGRDAEADLARLQTKLAAKCTQASVSLA